MRVWRFDLQYLECSALWCLPWPAWPLQSHTSSATMSIHCRLQSWQSRSKQHLAAPRMKCGKQSGLPALLLITWMISNAALTGLSFFQASSSALSATPPLKPPLALPPRPWRRGAVRLWLCRSKRVWPFSSASTQRPVSRLSSSSSPLVGTMLLPPSLWW